MAKAEQGEKMKSDKRQTMVLIGVAMLVIAGVLIYVALSQPKVYETVTQKGGYAATQPAGEVQAEAQEQEQEADVVYKDSVIPQVQNGETKTTASKTVQQVQDNDSGYSYPINLNTATFDELMSIDGIGEVRASAILEYRDYLGGYTSVEQIMEIKGISENIYAEIAGYLTV